MAALLACAAMGASATEADVDHPVEKRKFNLPPSADLTYVINAQQNGVLLSGNTTLRWSTVEGKFLIDEETRASLLGTVLDEKSEGNIDQYGLAPASFTESRFHKGATTTSFDHSTEVISFSNSADTYALKGGEQDRNSAIWQLVAVARGAQGKFKPDSEWRFFVAGSHDAETWTFKVGKRESIHTSIGDISSVHVVRVPADGKGQQVDIWLAPSLEWYPVQMRFTEASGGYIEQVLYDVKKAAD